MKYADIRQKLNNGQEIPMIGLGTFHIKNEKELNATLTKALELGYRHFDTAPVYDNEELIGKFFEKQFKSGKYHREEIYIGTKIWNTDHYRIEDALEESLKRLRMKYVDYLYIHWPVTFETGVFNTIKREVTGKPKIKSLDPVKIWLDMERVIDTNKALSIGLSNFGAFNIRQILDDCHNVPQLLQIECHPYLQQNELVNFCNEMNIVVVASSPLGGDSAPEVDMRKDDLIVRIARRMEISPAQTILSFTAMRNIPMIPRTTNVEFLKQNMELRELENDDYESIVQIGKNHRFINPEIFGDKRFL